MSTASASSVVTDAANDGLIVIGLSLAGVIASANQKAATVVALVMAIACLDQYYLYLQAKKGN